MSTARRSDHPQMSILFDIWLISNLTAGLLDDDLMQSGMSGDDFGLYSLLKAFGPAAPGQISRWTGLRPTTVSATLKRLAARGHTVQQRNGADGRSYLVALSEEGQGAHARTAQVFWDETRKLAQLLGPGDAARRQALQSLDADLREAAGFEPRPYRLADDTEQQTWDLRYDGAPLSAKQEDQVRQYIEFIRASNR
jgi:DNA-binding MarR family transcriptional regulator